MPCTSKEKKIKSPHPIKSKREGFFAKGVTEKQFREQILAPQYLNFLHNQWTSPGSFPYHYSNCSKYEIK